MARILAINPDPGQTTILQRLIGERLNAEVFVTASAGDAIEVLAEKQPDLILTAGLLSPAEGDQLAAHLRDRPALDYLPILTIPPLVEARDNTPASNFVSRFFRRHPERRPAYDENIVAARIEEALAQSRADATRYGEGSRSARLLVEDRTPEETVPVKQNLVHPLDAVLERYLGPSPQQHARRGEGSGAHWLLLGDKSLEETGADEPGQIHALDADLECHLGPSPFRPRAPRWSRVDLPWLECIKLTWGVELRLVNLSSSGLLVESGIRMTLGNLADFQLEDRNNRDLIIPGRVVRSDVSSVTSFGVKYVTAAVFETPFELLGPDGSPLAMRHR